MNKKILAVDLDETLFNTDKSISKENIDALNEMLDAGHVLAVDTGRPLHVMEKLLAPFGVFDRDNVYFIGYQGSVGVKAGEEEILFGDYLDNEAAVKMITHAYNQGLSTIAFENGAIYIFGDDYNTQQYAALAKEPLTIIESPEQLKGKKLIKFMVVNFEEPQKLHDFETQYMFEASEHFVSMFSNVAFLEYVGKDCSKGAGLTQLAKLLGVSIKNTVACGDERNDISMVEMAGVGAAVNNARPELKEVADYITENDNNHGAVAEVIRKFILN